MAEVYYHPKLPLTKGDFYHLYVVMDPRLVFLVSRRRELGDFRAAVLKTKANGGNLRVGGAPIRLPDEIHGEAFKNLDENEMAILKFMLANFGRLISRCGRKDLHQEAADAAAKVLSEVERMTMETPPKKPNLYESTNNVGISIKDLPSMDSLVAFFQEEFCPVKNITEDFAIIFAGSGLRAIPLGKCKIFEMV